MGDGGGLLLPVWKTDSELLKSGDSIPQHLVLFFSSVDM